MDATTNATRNAAMDAAVLDTNVWLDWLVFDDPGVQPLKAHARATRLCLPVTARIRAELIDVLGRPLIRARGRDRGDLVTLFDGMVKLCDDPPACGLTCRDQNDQMFIDLAVAQRTGWLISKDKDLLSLAAKARRNYGLTISRPPSATQLGG